MARKFTVEVDGLVPWFPQMRPSTSEVVTYARERRRAAVRHMAVCSVSVMVSIGPVCSSGGGDAVRKRESSARVLVK
jgi:hypothetical protein